MLPLPLPTLSHLLCHRETPGVDFYFFAKQMGEDQRRVRGLRHLIYGKLNVRTRKTAISARVTARAGQ